MNAQKQKHEDGDGVTEWCVERCTEDQVDRSEKRKSLEKSEMCIKMWRGSHGKYAEVAHCSRDVKLLDFNDHSRRHDVYPPPKPILLHVWELQHGGAHFNVIFLS